MYECVCELFVSVLLRNSVHLVVPCALVSDQNEWLESEVQFPAVKKNRN